MSIGSITGEFPKPPPGQNAGGQLGGNINFMLLPQPGVQPIAVTVPVTGQLNVTGGSGNGGNINLISYNTEMLSLDIAGGNLPPNIKLRESPTLPSTGRTTIESLPGGQFGISSFFDIFTEISLDGGQSWSPAQSPLRLELQPVTPVEPPATRPRLEVQRLLSGQLQLCWPATQPGFVLQATDDLQSPKWLAPPATQQTSGDRNCITIDLGLLMRFFRLSTANQ
ncbi:MAG: hypothetical protein EXS31_09455 [Pedosphaera sp.]|nr:hypothetical protein [Pedosphaera sp.]